MSQKTANAAPSPLAASGPLSSAEIKKRLDEACAPLPSLRGRPAAIRQERELRKKSDPELADAVFAEFDRREKEAELAATRAEERALGLASQYSDALDREWLDRAQKARLEIEKLAGARADEVYRKTHELILALGKALSEMRLIHETVETFDKVAGARAGFIDPPENRIRRGTGRSRLHHRPLWEELRRLPMVSGNGYLEIEPPKNLLFTEHAPKPAAIPAGDAPMTPLKADEFSVFRPGAFLKRAERTAGEPAHDGGFRPSQFFTLPRGAQQRSE